MNEFGKLEKEVLLYYQYSSENDKEKSEKSIKNIIDIMHSEEIQSYISEFMKVYQTQKMDQSSIINLENIVKATQIIYNYSGEDTGITDTTYDIIYEVLEMHTIYSDEFMTVPNPDKNVVLHKYKSLRGTLDKIYYLKEEDEKDMVNKSRKGLPEWVKSSERKIHEKTGENINLWEEDVYIFPKWDGVSNIFEFNKNGKLQRVLTRGYTSTNEAQLVTHIFKDWVEGPYNDKDNEYGLKTEIMMSEEDLEKYNREYKTNYKNTRSIVSSIINSDEIDDRVSYLQIMSLRISELNKDGEESLQTLAPGAFNQPFIQCKLKDVDKIEKFAMTHKYVNGLRCDGAVIYIINPKIQKILGRENEKQKFEVAYKFTEEIGYSKIKEIEFSTGLFGTINPIAIFKPIKLKGNEISNASLGSMDRFRDLKLAKGDRVKILYDIIPYCQFDVTDPNCKRSGNVPIEEPTHCTDCGSVLEVRGNTGLYCANHKCPCRKKGKILNFINKMNIDGISYAIVDILYDEGYLKNIKDLYKLQNHKKELYQLEGFGKKSINNILNEIESHKTISESVLLGSLGIDSISTKLFKKVLQYIKYDELMELCSSDNKEKAISILDTVPGIAEKNAEKIYIGIRDNKDLIEFLEDELSILEETKETGKRFKVCFTKIRDKELEDWIVEKNGIVTDSVTKDTDILIVPMKGVSSGSVEKALRYNIDIVPIDDFKNYCMKNYHIK